MNLDRRPAADPHALLRRRAAMRAHSRRAAGAWGNAVGVALREAIRVKLK